MYGFTGTGTVHTSSVFAAVILSALWTVIRGDSLVRDSGGEVLDTGECRTDSSQRCCMACKTFCAALCMGLVAIIVLAVNKRL